MEVKVEKFDYEGRGLTHVDKEVFFLPRALPGERVEISVLKSKRNFKVGKVLKILDKSDARVLSFCPYANSCGGCTFDIVSYENSLKFKKEILKDLFLKNKILLPSFSIEPSRPVLEYRNKVSLHVCDGKFGYYEEKSHIFVPILKCALLSQFITRLLDDFSLFFFSNGSLMIRVNDKGECILGIDSKDEVKINKTLLEKHLIKGIFLNGKLVYGNSYFIENRNNIFYKVPFDAFFQVNPYISQKILMDVKSFFQKEDTVFDLYCGVGFFSIPLALSLKSVIGIELNQKAVLGAIENARLNNLSNVSFHVGKVEEVLKKIPLSSKKVLVDPPRSGLHQSVVSYFLEHSIEQIVYISCNPITLVRDLKLLLSNYCITFFKVYDMFSFTKHVECVCVLNRC